MKESSTIKDVMWIEGHLIVTFKTGAVYQYADVPEQVYSDFLAADSLGKFFTTNVKPKYEGTKAPERKLYVHGSDVPGAWPFPTGSKP